MNSSNEPGRHLPLERTCVFIIVQAHHALAVVQCARAVRLNGEKQIRQAGTQLRTAARHVHHAATWLGRELGRGLSAAAAEAGALGEQLEAGSQSTPDDITRAFVELSKAIEALGAHTGTAPKNARNL